MEKKKALKLIWRGVQIISYINLIRGFIRARGLQKENDLEMIIDMADLLQGNKIEGPDDIIFMDDAELHVTFNPYIHLITNAIGSVAVVYNTGDIIVDNVFRKMSRDTKRAILAHELGHLKLKHKAPKLYALRRLAYVFAGQVLEMELEADAYGANIVGHVSMINALEVLKCHLGYMARKEIDLRIDILRKGVIK